MIEKFMCFEYPNMSHNFVEGQKNTKNTGSRIIREKLGKGRKRPIFDPQGV